MPGSCGGSHVEMGWLQKLISLICEFIKIHVSSSAAVISLSHSLFSSFLLSSDLSTTLDRPTHHFRLANCRQISAGVSAGAAHNLSWITKNHRLSRSLISLYVLFFIHFSVVQIFFFFTSGAVSFLPYAVASSLFSHFTVLDFFFPKSFKSFDSCLKISSFALFFSRNWSYLLVFSPYWATINTVTVCRTETQTGGMKHSSHLKLVKFVLANYVQICKRACVLILQKIETCVCYMNGAFL